MNMQFPPELFGSTVISKNNNYLYFILITNNYILYTIILKGYYILSFLLILSFRYTLIPVCYFTLTIYGDFFCHVETFDFHVTKFINAFYYQQTALAVLYCRIMKRKTQTLSCFPLALLGSQFSKIKYL